MTRQQALDTIKTALRVSGTDFDGELEMLMGAGVADMSASGATITGEDYNEWAVLALTLYCKMHFGASADETEKYSPIYDMAVAKLSDSTGCGYL